MPKCSDLRGNVFIILTEEETRQFNAVDSGQTFSEMIEDEQLFPRDTFFIGFVFDGDMGDVDVAGWNFSGANLSGADMSKVRNINKAVFDHMTKLDGTILPNSVITEMLL